MRHVVFKTPGLIDIRSFTVMGLSSKPNSDSPIGKFGTGLKMAIAVLVRNKIPVTLWIGRTKYTFKAKKIKFRGTEGYEQLVMFKEVQGLRKVLSKSEELLPFTTELGKFWELWQAYRELESNTRDEDGQTILLNHNETIMHSNHAGVDSAYTHIIVSGEKFVQEYLDREKTFLPEGLKQRDESSGEVQILDRPSQHIYWRGIRVHDLPKDKPSALTYNILADIELTEDRTAKSPYMLEYYIRQKLVRSEDVQVVEKALKATPRSFEGSLNYDYESATPTPTFSSVALRRSGTSAYRYASARVEKPKKADPWLKYPRPWTIDAADGLQIFDANGMTVGKMENEELVALIVQKINLAEPTFDPEF